MKHICLVLINCINFFVFSQKPIINETTFDKWTRLQESMISNNGKYVTYTYGPVNGTDILCVQSTDLKFRKAITEGSEAIFSANSRWLMYKTPGDTLFVLDLIHKTSIVKTDVKDFKIASENSEWLIYRKSGSNQAVYMHNLVTEKERKYFNVKKFIINNNGSALLLILDGALLYVDLRKNSHKIIKHGIIPDNIIFDYQGKQIAFMLENEEGVALNYYRPGMDSAKVVVENSSEGIRLGYKLSNNSPQFSSDGKKVFFSLSHIVVRTDDENAKPAQMNVWHYSDEYIQPEQFKRNQEYESLIYTAVLNVNTGSVVQLDSVGVLYRSLSKSKSEKYALVSNDLNRAEGLYRNSISLNLSVVHTDNGVIINNINSSASNISEIVISPNDKYVVWFDNSKKQYDCYDVSEGLLRKNISRGINYPLENRSHTITSPFGIAGWSELDKTIYMYDEFDIWAVDPLGLNSPINLTHGFGRKNNITLRFCLNKSNIIQPTDRLLCATNNVTKENGFFRLRGTSSGDPLLLTMGPYHYYMNSMWRGWFISNNSIPQKAKYATGYLVYRESEKESPNLFYTKDFKRFNQLSEIYPETQYNWLTTSLIRYQIGTDDVGEGILYKPENFDSTKKYPVIFNYYDDRRTFELHCYKRPEYNGSNVNIPSYVSNGYLVCIPNLYYKTGKIAHGIATSVEAAAKYLSCCSWVDKSKMGIQWHSFGGYATNSIITRSNLFRVACEASGPADYISGYLSLMDNVRPAFDVYESESGQLNAGGNLWDSLAGYLENSPVLRLDKITTPLLMAHGKQDYRVPFFHAIELYNGLRRLNKKVWLLEYSADGHILSPYNAMDFSRRMQQFFDHYLKGMPPPIWMLPVNAAGRK